MKKVLLITSPRHALWFEENGDIARGMLEFSQKVSNDTVSLDVTTLDRLEFTITDDGQDIYDNYTQRSLRDYEALHLRSVHLSPAMLDYASAITAFAHANGIQLIEPVDTGLSIGKLSQMMRFSLQGIPIPATYASWDHMTLRSMVERTLSFPCIIKANNGMKGTDNYKVDSQQELETLLAGLPEDTPFVAQEFIANEGDYRVFFMGSEQPPLIFMRKGSGSSHLNNTSKGAEAFLVEMNDFDTHALAIAQQVYTLTGRALSGVDLMQNAETGAWVSLEANVSPALTMGSYLDEKASMYRHLITQKEDL